MESQFKRCLSMLDRVLDPLICCLLVMLLENSEVELCKYRIFKSSKFVKKNEHVPYTVEYFPVDNAHVMYTKGLNS
jgi:hypothetical protein